MKLNGTWFTLLTSDKAVFAETARPKGSTSVAAVEVAGASGGATAVVAITG